MIYRHVLAGKEFTLQRKASDMSKTMQLINVCKQTRMECSTIFWAENTFVILSPTLGITNDRILCPTQALRYAGKNNAKVVSNLVIKYSRSLENRQVLRHRIIAHFAKLGIRRQVMSFVVLPTNG
jgi:hypothetical protein